MRTGIVAAHERTSAVGTMAEEQAPVRILFMGGALVPGLPNSALVTVASPVTVAELFGLLEGIVGMSSLRERVSGSLIILVDGTSIQHLEGWETLVCPGASVAVVAPMGGG